MSVVDSVKILKGRELTDDEYFNAALVGWCIELVSFNRVRPTRRGSVLTIHIKPSFKLSFSFLTTSWTPLSLAVANLAGIVNHRSG